MASSSTLNGFSGRDVAFHSLPSSKIVSEAPTAEDAINLADLNWTVGLEPTYQRLVNPDGSILFDEVTDKFLTVREDTKDVLGVVGKNYRTFQNHEAFSFADELLGYGVEFDAAGHYAGSTKVFLTAKLPTGITVGDGDNLDLYLLFKTSHDGSAAITAQITPVRLSCTNMMNLAANKAVTKWSARHTAKASEKVAEAARTLQLVDQYRVEFAAMAAQLLATEVDLTGFEALTKQVTASERLHKGMIQTWNNSPTVDRTTGWGAVNAIGEFMEHERGGKGNSDSRFDSNLDGQTASVRNRAAQLLLVR